MATGDDSHRNAADRLFVPQAADFDPVNGVFTSMSAHNVDDVAWIMGGLNSQVQQGGDDRRPTASAMLLSFQRATLGLAGMQLTAQPGMNGAMASPWEMDLPGVEYYHPATSPRLPWWAS